MDRPRTNGADPPWVAFFGWDGCGMEPVGWTVDETNRRVAEDVGTSSAVIEVTGEGGGVLFPALQKKIYSIFHIRESTNKRKGEIIRYVDSKQSSSSSSSATPWRVSKDPKDRPQVEPGHFGETLMRGTIAGKGVGTQAPPSGITNQRTPN